MPWSLDVSLYCALVESEQLEYGVLYNAVLRECFRSTFPRLHPFSQSPICSPFHFCLPTDPSLPVGSSGCPTFKRLRSYEVVGDMQLKSALLFVATKPVKFLTMPNKRKVADEEMRERLRQLSLCSTRVPKLFGVCAFGRNFAFYKYDRVTGEITPPKIPQPDSIDETVETAPIEWWSTNVMDEDGREKFLELVEEVKSMANELLPIDPNASILSEDTS
ncbi:hypothetical protein BDQ17DRAFT_1429438 [Cyathus striatus]|nr:hypothetical protein BDQ17DRAFT_1429438 [Cyathus striatus]